MSNRLVKQLDEFGCGFACVAVLLNINYGDAIILFDGDKQKAVFAGFSCKEIVQALSIKGVNARHKYLKPKLKRSIYIDGVIVFIKRNKKYPSGHYLLRSGSKWMDPWINFQRNKNIEKSLAGYRKRLPSRPIYAIFIGE